MAFDYTLPVLWDLKADVKEERDEKNGKNLKDYTFSYLRRGLVRDKSEIDKVSKTWYKIVKNNFEWSEFVPMIANLDGPLEKKDSIIEIKIPSGAFLKMYEILVYIFTSTKNKSTLMILENLKNKTNYKTFHLCELPGAMVGAFEYILENHKIFANVEHEWWASSKYAEDGKMDCDPTFFNATKNHWVPNPDKSSGDIFEWETIEEILGNGRTGEIDFVTADGGLGSDNDPNNQESNEFPLIFAQCKCALHLLNAGGTLVVKMFTVLEHATQRLCWTLSQLFSHLEPIKPKLSKPTNGEIYMSCRDYFGPGTDQGTIPLINMGRDEWKKYNVGIKMRMTEEFLDAILPGPPTPELSKRWEIILFKFQYDLTLRQRKYILHYIKVGLKDLGQETKVRRKAIAKECWKQWNEKLEKHAKELA